MELQYTKLQQETAGLQQTFELLGAELTGAARQIVNPGVCPPESLANRITEARQQFEAVRGEVRQLAASMLVQPLPALEGLTDMAAVQRLLESVAAAEDNRRSATDEQAAALALLARVQTIVHREKKEFAPLAECRAAVGSLHEAIAKTEWPERHPEAAALLSGQHALNSLLTLLDQGEDLDEEQWAAHEDAVAGLYGRTLVVAASRGKLEFAMEPAPEAAAPVEPEPPAAVVIDPDPEPVAVAEPEPAEVAAEPEPAPAVVELKAEPEPAPLAAAQSEPEPEAAVAAIPAEPQFDRAPEADLAAFAEAVAEPEAIPAAVAQSPAEPAVETPEPVVAALPEPEPFRMAEAVAEAEPAGFSEVRIGPISSDGEETRNAGAADPQRPQRWGFWRGSR